MCHSAVSFPCLRPIDPIPSLWTLSLFNPPVYAPSHPSGILFPCTQSVAFIPSCYDCISLVRPYTCEVTGCRCDRLLHCLRSYHPHVTLHRLFPHLHSVALIPNLSTHNSIHPSISHPLHRLISSSSICSSHSRFSVYAPSTLRIVSFCSFAINVPITIVCDTEDTERQPGILFPRGGGHCEGLAFAVCKHWHDRHG